MIDLWGLSQRDRPRRTFVLRDERPFPPVNNAQHGIRIPPNR